MTSFTSYHKLVVVNGGRVINNNKINSDNNFDDSITPEYDYQCSNVFEKQLIKTVDTNSEQLQTN